MQAINNRFFRGIRRFLKSIAFGLNIFTLLLLLSSWLSWTVSPERFSIFAYLGLGFAFTFIAAILFLFVWSFARKWKMLAVNVLVILICIKPITAYFPVNIFSSKAPEKTLKVMTYNVRGFAWDVNRGWDKKHPMVEYIKSVDPDIICMQEYLSVGWGVKTNTRNLLKALKKYPYYSMTKLRPGDRYEYGLLCLSKYPIKKVLPIPIVTSDNGSVLYEIDVDGKRITLINNHLESNRLASDDKKMYKKFIKQRDSQMLDEITHNLERKLGGAYKVRAPQADLIAHYISEQKTDATIVCGDFNDTPISYTYRTISKNLVDSYVETAFGPRITYHENFFWFRIDFLMHSKNVKAYNTTIDKVNFSDHYPVWTCLDLN